MFFIFFLSIVMFTIRGHILIQRLKKVEGLNESSIVLFNTVNTLALAKGRVSSMVLKTDEGKDILAKCILNSRIMAAIVFCSIFIFILFGE